MMGRNIQHILISTLSLNTIYFLLLKVADHWPSRASQFLLIPYVVQKTFLAGCVPVLSMLGKIQHHHRIRKTLRLFFSHYSGMVNSFSQVSKDLQPDIHVGSIPGYISSQADHLWRQESSTCFGRGFCYCASSTKHMKCS